MRHKILFYLLLIVVIINTSCDDNSSRKISFTILQLNDVYEIAPMNNGKVAGLARVATIRNQLLSENKNTITIMAGDFLSPSLTGTMKIDGKRVSGAQMVETLNVLGLDYATFGNHEFDLKEADLNRRINESNFTWTSANTFHKTDSGVFDFEKSGDAINRYIIHTFKNKEGDSMKLGIISVTLPFNKADYVSYDDIYESFGNSYEEVKNKCDFIIAMTHLDIEDDIKLAEKFPDLLMILGGHEHVNSSHLIGNVHIKKADANAKTAYVHRITIDEKSGQKKVESELIHVTDAITEDAMVKKVVDKWENISNANLSNLGYDPNKVLYETNDTLIVLESAIRSRSTNFTEIVMNAFHYGFAEADVALCNSGSIRLDDILTGEIYQFDILKTFPYGGPLVVATMNGEMLQKTLETSVSKNINTGGFLQVYGANSENGDWYINGSIIDKLTNYQVLLPSFLAAGNEQNLDFLKDAPVIELTSLGPNKVKNDVRDLVIDYLKNQK